ncbi:hypothetical protein R1sor_024638 [Riccia sorocarpa]|uniref:SET domain-containing protein n=1 Tax=Riccia sorocarpa TaxID=122646 RepID=A0ABD3GU30_9MARC
MVDQVERLRLEGKNLFESGRWTEAVRVFGQYIDLLKEGGSTEQLVLGYSNRAQTFLRLQKYADALEDTEKALNLDSLHMKSLVRKAKALFGLKLYEETVGICKKFLRRDDLPPAYRKTISDLLPEARRKDEQTRLGMFGTTFPSISYRYEKPGDAPSDIEDFVGPVELKRTLGVDRGLFATRDLIPGDFLFVASPLTSVRHPKLLGSKVDSDSQVAGLNSTLLRDLVEMVKHARGNLKDFSQVQFLVQLDTLQAHILEQLTFITELDEDVLFDIVRRRQSEPIGMIPERATGIYFLQTFLKHSCLPNVTIMDGGERTTNPRASFAYRASRKIKKGDQLFNTYRSVYVPLEDRIALLGRLQCTCERCALEEMLLQEIPVLRKLEYRCSRLFMVSAENSPMFLPEQQAEMRRDSIQCIEAVNELFRTEPKLQDLMAIQKDWIRASFVCLYWQLLEPALALGVNASEEDHIR